MSDSKATANKDGLLESKTKLASQDTVRKHAEKQAPKPDDLQLNRQEVAEAGLAHGSFNQYQPMSDKDYSVSDVVGDKDGGVPHTPENTVTPKLAESPAGKDDPAVPEAADKPGKSDQAQLNSTSK